MAEQLKNTLSFANLAPGASIVLPHGLRSQLRALAPDIVFIPSPDLDVAASDATNITLTNHGAAPISGAVLVEAWHTIERAFGDDANEDAPIKPYVVVSVENNNQPPWPPFSETTLKIYANATGSDATGDGTQAKPYRTFQRAAQDIPRQIAPGNRVIVDVTNLGLEVLPPNYALPSLDSPFGIEFSYVLANAADYYPFTTATALEIIAKPKLATLAQGSNTLGAGNILAVMPDPDTNLMVVQTNQDYGAADSLKGKLVQDPVGLRGIIWHNTAGPNSVLYLTIPHMPDEFIAPVFESPPTGFPPGFPQGFPVPIAPPLQIVEQSAEFQTQKAPNSVLRGGFVIAGSGSIGVRGIKIQLAPAFANPTGFDTEVWGSRTVFLEAAQLDGLLIAHSVGQIILLHVNVHDAIFLTEASTGLFSSMLQNVPSLGLPFGPPAAIEAIGFVLDGCAALGPRYNPLQPAGRGPMVDLQLRNGVIMNSVADLNFGQIAAPENFPAPFVPFSINPAFAVPGHGIYFPGGKGIVDHVKIFGCTSDGVHAEAGAGFLELKSVTGGQGGIVFGDLTDTANAGIGLLVTDGIFCRISDDDPAVGIASNVFGTGGEIKVGDAGGLTDTWANFLGVTKSLFDITAVAGTGATGSGSRVFKKP